MENRKNIEKSGNLEKIRIEISNLQESFNLKIEDLKKYANGQGILNFIHKKRLENEIKRLKEKINENKLKLSIQVAKQASDLNQRIEKDKNERIKLKLIQKKPIKAKPGNLQKKQITPLPQIPFFESNKLEEFPKLILKQSVSNTNETRFPKIPRRNKNPHSTKQGIFKVSTGNESQQSCELLNPVATSKKYTFEVKELPILEKIPKKSKKTNKFPNTKFLVYQEFQNINQEFKIFKHKIDTLDNSFKKTYNLRKNEQELILKSLIESEDMSKNLLKLEKDMFKSIEV